MRNCLCWQSGKGATGAAARAQAKLGSSSPLISGHFQGAQSWGRLLTTALNWAKHCFHGPGLLQQDPGAVRDSSTLCDLPKPQSKELSQAAQQSGRAQTRVLLTSCSILQETGRKLSVHHCCLKLQFPAGDRGRATTGANAVTAEFQPREPGASSSQQLLTATTGLALQWSPSQRQQQDATSLCLWIQNTHGRCIQSLSAKGSGPLIYRDNKTISLGSISLL